MKDNRYKAVKSLIETNSFKKLIDVFEIVPISVVRIEVKMNYNTLQRRVTNPELLTAKDINALAELFEVEPNLILSLAIAGFKKVKK
ncbi:hypothetical protein [Ferruginibacter sp.]|nr:hypothetical protein [Ferruginibacter sp.]